MTDFVRLPEGDSPSHTHVILWHSAEALNTWLKEYTNISNVRNWESSKPSTRIYETERK